MWDHWAAGPMVLNIDVKSLSHVGPMDCGNNGLCGQYSSTEKKKDSTVACDAPTP